MSGRNTAVFGLYPDESELAEGIEQLKRAGFRTTDLSILLPENLGSKDIGHEKHTKAPEGAAIGGAAGAVTGGALGWLINAAVIAAPLEVANPLIAAAPAIAILAGAGALGILGAIVGALAGSWRPEYEAKRYEGRIRSGGVLLSVHCDNSSWRARATEALTSTGAKGIASMGESKADFGASEKPKPRVLGSEFFKRRTFLHVIPPDGTPDQPNDQGATSA